VRRAPGFFFFVSQRTFCVWRDAEGKNMIGVVVVLVALYFVLRLLAWLEVELCEIEPGGRHNAVIRANGKMIVVGLTGISVRSLEYPYTRIFRLSYLSIFPHFLSSSSFHQIEWRFGWLERMEITFRADSDIRGVWLDWRLIGRESSRSFAVIKPRMQ
jgi:hypothetical protein